MAHVVPMTAPTKGSHLRADIQGLRGVAVLIGLAYHAGFEISGGYIAFDMFFVVSGYVIAGMLGRELARHGRINLSAFYKRRFRRLIPALAVAVTATVIASALLLTPTEPQRIVYKSAFGALLLYANSAVPNASGDYFAADAKLNPLLHTWSLSLEEQVYLVFPALLLLGWAASRRWPRLRLSPSLVVAAACAVSFCFATASSDHQSVLGLPPTLGGYHGPASRFWEFGAGALVALHADRLRAGLPARLRAGAAVVATLSLFVLVFLLNEATPYPDVITLWPVAAILCVLLADPSSVVPTVLSNRFVVHVGDISYSWYLWHWPMISLTDSLTDRRWVIVAAALLSYLPARLSYRWLEKPFTLSQPPPGSMPRFVAVVLVPPLLLTAALAAAVHAGYWSTEVRMMQAADAPHLPETLGCHVPEKTLCRLSGGAGPPVYIVGDSNAAQYAEGILAAADEQDRPVIAVTRGECPLIDVRLWWGTGVDHGVDQEQRSSGCNEASRLVVDLLPAQPAASIVMAFGANSFLLDDARLLAPGVDPDEADNGNRVQIFSQALERTAAAYRRAGHTVVIAQPMPLVPESWQPDQCKVFTIMADRCSFHIGRAEATQPLTSARTSVARVARDLGVDVFDPLPYLCDDTCDSEYEGKVQYRGISHISVSTSARMAREWALLLDETDAQGAPVRRSHALAVSPADGERDSARGRP